MEIVTEKLEMEVKRDPGIVQSFSLRRFFF